MVMLSLRSVISAGSSMAGCFRPSLGVDAICRAASGGADAASAPDCSPAATASWLAARTAGSSWDDGSWSVTSASPRLLRLAQLRHLAPGHPGQVGPAVERHGAPGAPGPHLLLDGDHVHQQGDLARVPGLGPAGGAQGD